MSSPKRSSRRSTKGISIKQAIRAASKVRHDPIRHSCWLSTIDSRKSGRKVGVIRHNLTTTTASGYTNAFDWLAKAMGQGPSFAGTWSRQSGGFTVTATQVSSLTGLPTAGQGLAGGIVVVYGNTNNSIVYGVIASNTGTAVTVDQWYDATSSSGAVGTTPTGTTFFVIFLPGQNPASWMAVTSNVFSPSTADTSLAGELTTNGFARAVGTYAHTAAASTYTLTHLWTATGTQTINNEAILGAATTAAGGVMPFESAEPSPPTLVSGDTLTNVVTVTI